MNIPREMIPVLPRPQDALFSDVLGGTPSNQPQGFGVDVHSKSCPVPMFELSLERELATHFAEVAISNQ